ncbi:aromatic acid/H+ symport family MFS transporter [Leifsonia shinshuensis]|uniref:MFS transporter n=1 Tax=Leifsonia shinshuensis TaxID=150026 RepID=UPI001F50EA4B|nr:aromatic acid/H+ symport family MFS transporter [Leifsonia shinshuensis]MCI0155665.1 aromatic acid/H+ symport family MFS transporter [Leifsonia shinshuensis]
MESTTRTRFWPLVLCWVIVALDGFDLVVLGTVIPTLLSTHELGFDAPAATAVATAGLVGVGIGALTVGPLADRYGRRVCLLLCVTVFSLLTLAIVIAPNILVFGLLRVLAGLALGACLPVVIAYVTDLMPRERAGKATTLTMTGYHAGAVLTALLALAVIPDWRVLFAIGGIAGLVTVPLIRLALPEERRGQQTEQRPTVRRLVERPYLTISIGVWVASFMGLLLVYGLNTWLPQLMRDAGYGSTDSLGLLLILNAGAVTGLILAGIVADRSGTKRIAMTWFAASGVLLAFLSIRLEEVTMLYVAVFVTGVFVFSAQVLVYAFVTQLYPPEIRSTALGFAAGIGRLGAIMGPAITGLLVSEGLAYPGGFYVFAATALLAVGALAIIPARARIAAAPVTAPE